MKVNSEQRWINVGKMKAFAMQSKTNVWFMEKMRPEQLKHQLQSLEAMPVIISHRMGGHVPGQPLSGVKPKPLTSTQINWSNNLKGIKYKEYVIWLHLYKEEQAALSSMFCGCVCRGYRRGRGASAPFQLFLQLLPLFLRSLSCARLWSWRWHPECLGTMALPRSCPATAVAVHSARWCLWPEN